MKGNPLTPHVDYLPSVGDLFLGALTPGVVLAGMFALYVVGVAAFKPELAPALPEEARDITGRELTERVFQSH